MSDALNPTSLLRVHFGEFDLDEANARLLRDGRAVRLSPKPFELLCALLRVPGILLSKNVLLDQVWGHRYVSDSVLKGAISEIRTALGDDPRCPRYVETVSRRGYRAIVSVAPIEEAGVRAFDAGSSVVPAATPGALFVGRAKELTRLRQGWDRAVHGSRAIIWIAGEPGIGKTALIEHFTSGLGSVVYVRGQCVQHHGTGEPYLPVLEALAELCRHDPEVAALMHDVAPTWLLQIPWLSTAAQREGLLQELVGANPQRMLREMGELIDRYTERQPLLLVTEDLHWADRSTVQLIDYMARRRGSSHLMWLSSFRLTEIIALDHPLNTLRHELRTHGLCDEILLDSFSEMEVAAYMVERAPSVGADEQFVRVLHERTGGVPLFVAAVAGEVLDRAARSGNADETLIASTTVPDSLAGLIDHYVAVLTRERRELLLAAAVCGMSLRVEILARVLGREAIQIAETCDELVRERLWLVDVPSICLGDRAEPAYAFRHTLFRQRLYDGASASLRSELHRRVGAALEEARVAGQNVAAGELALHFELGRSPIAAMRYYAEAAQAALLHLSPSEAMNLTGRSLALANMAPPGAERRALEITLQTLRGVAAFNAFGAGEEAASAYRSASSLLVDGQPHPMSGLVLHGLGFLLYLRADYSEALAVAERAAIQAASGNDPVLLLAAYAVKGQVLMMRGQCAEARTTLERAIPVLERLSAAAEQHFIGFVVDPQTTVLAMLSLPLTQLGLFSHARERLQQAYTRAKQLAQPMALMVTIWFDALCAIRRGDVMQVGALADEMQSLVDRFGLATGGAAGRWFRGWADAHSGKPREGFRRIREAYEENRALGMISGSSETLGYAAEALLVAGDPDRAQEQLDQAFEIVNIYGERVFLPQLLLVQARIETARDVSATAENSIRRAIDEAKAQGALWLQLQGLSALVERAVASSDEQLALSKLVAQVRDVSDVGAAVSVHTPLRRFDSE